MNEKETISSTDVGTLDQIVDRAKPERYIPASEHSIINLFFADGEVPPPIGLEPILEEHLAKLGWLGDKKDIVIKDYNVREQVFNEGAIVAVHLAKPVTLRIGKDAPDAHALLVSDLIKREPDKWKQVLAQWSLSSWFVSRAAMMSKGKLNPNRVREIIDHLAHTYIPPKKEEPEAENEEEV